jgi:hypothetical protein
MSGLFFLLDCYNQHEIYNNEPLSHDGGKLFKWLIDRQSIGPMNWTFDYCCRKLKKEIPTQKEARKSFLATHMELLHKEMAEAKRVYGEIVIIGLGKLSCECLLDEVDLKNRAGTYWVSSRKLWHDIIEEGEVVWVANSPDAALFDAQLIVEITRVIKMGAKQAGIATKWLNNTECPMPDLSNYL